MFCLPVTGVVLGTKVRAVIGVEGRVLLGCVQDKRLVSVFVERVILWVHISAKHIKSSYSAAGLRKKSCRTYRQFALILCVHGFDGVQITAAVQLEPTILDGQCDTGQDDSDENHNEHATCDDHTKKNEFHLNKLVK